MPLPQLTITQAPAKLPIQAARSDVPLFVGLIARRTEASLPPPLAAWLQASEFCGTGQLARTPDQLDSLLDVPVPIDSFAEFEALFDWQARPLVGGSPETVPTRLGLAVEQFFAEGGARCWIVRTGDPLPVMASLVQSLPDPAETARYRSLIDWPQSAPPADKAERVPLLPAFVPTNRGAFDPYDPSSWSGAGLAYAVEEAAYVCLPDLPDLVAGPALRLPDPEFPPLGQENFIPCAPEDDPPPPPEGAGRPAFAAPRLDLAGFDLWAKALRGVLSLLEGRGGAEHRRDMIHVAALPLPDLADPAMPPDAETWPLALDDPSLPAFGGTGLFSEALAACGRQVLVYPWLATERSVTQGQGVCSAEGIVLGRLAQRVLTGGVHAIAAGPVASRVRGTVPELAAEVLRREPAGGPYGWLGDALALLGWRRSDFHLLSDVTSTRDDAWRDGQVARIMGALLRHARHVGLDAAFADNGPQAWGRAKQSMEQLLDGFWRGGALSGGNAGEAYEVVCDRSTMLQSDIDQGRVIAHVRFRPTRTLQHIAVTLDLAGGAA